MTASSVLIILLAFQIKHFVCDFPLQKFPYMYQNKGKYLHFGGILHALVHAIGTAIICELAGLPGWLVLADFIIHYHIDWAKMKLNNKYKLSPTNSENFWILLGFDQLLHQLTYIGMVWMLL